MLQRISAHVQYDTKTIQLFRLAKEVKLSLYVKHCVNCETVVKL
jgi:hypothetical protein